VRADACDIATRAPRRPPHAPPYAHAEDGQYPPVRARWDHPCEPPSASTPLAPRASRPQAGRTDLRRPAYGVGAVPRPAVLPLAPMPRPLRPCVWSCTPPQGTRAYKRVGLAPTRIAPPHRAAIAATIGAHGELDPRSLASPTHLAPACPRTPVSSLVTCCSGQTPSSPVSELPRPPSGMPCRTCTSACSPRLWDPIESPLGHIGASCVAHCSAGPFPSPDFAPPRLCCPGAAATARRRPLRPSYRRQSLRGEPNRLPRRLFAYLCTPSPPASSSSPSVHGGGKQLW
jgi:hypothetical protein